MSNFATMDFTEKKRLHIAGLAVSFVRFAVRFLRQGVFLLIIILAQRPELLRSGYGWLILLGLLAVGVLYSYLHYRYYSYYVDLDKREFVVESGVVSKSKTVIKFSNIIQVNLDQNILQKLLSIYSVTINTAGSDKVEVDLYALDEPTALALREFLMDAIRVHEDRVEEGEKRDISSGRERTEILQIPAKNILLISLFSNYRQGLLLFFAFVMSLFQQIQDLFQALGREDDYELDVSNWQAWISVILFAGIFILLVPFVINLFRYFFKYYNFSILRNREGNFSMHYGLFNTKDVIFNKTRVQTISFRQNALLRYFNLAYLSLRQIVTDETKAAESTIEMPGVTLADKRTVYDLVFEKDIYTDMVERRPCIGLFINRTIKANLLFLPIVGAVWSLVDSYGLLIWTMAIVLELFMLSYNYLYYKNYRFYVGEEYLIKRTRVWNEVETVIPIRNTQIVQISQTFWQVRSETANLHLRTAADDVSFRFFEERFVKGLSNRLLYQLEQDHPRL